MYQSVMKSLFEHYDVPERLLTHSIRVAIYSKSLGEVMQLPADEMDSLYYGSLIHDIGKLRIPSDILFKRGKLSADEFEQIKLHPSLGAAMIEPIEALSALVPIVRSHHERIDGCGYPDGVSARQLPLVVRIISMVDAFDATTSKRRYRRRKSIDEAVQELMAGQDTQFDARLVDLFVQQVVPGLLLSRLNKQTERIQQSFARDKSHMAI